MYQKQRRRLIVPFIAPQFILYTVFMFLPLAATIFYGFTDWRGHGNPWHWAGLLNFRVILNDESFHKAARNAVTLTIVGVVLLFVPATFFAWAMQQPLKGRRFFQYVILAPVVIAASVAGLIWKWIYNPTQGLINPVLEKLHLGDLAQPWLGDTRFALTAIIVASIWHGIGTWVLLIAAGIERIPPDLPDAARVDGSGDWQVFRHITFPLMWEVMRILLILWIIQALQAFTFIFVMTGPVSVGGPLGSTEVMGTYVYKQAFSNFKWAYASALATTILLAILVLSIFVNRVTVREQVEY